MITAHSLPPDSQWKISPVICSPEARGGRVSGGMGFLRGKGQTLIQRRGTCTRREGERGRDTGSAAGPWLTAFECVITGNELSNSLSHRETETEIEGDWYGVNRSLETRLTRNPMVRSCLLWRGSGITASLSS